MLEPILVRPVGSKFEIVAGHRRYFACRLNSLNEIRAIVIEIPDKDAYEISLEENLQRQTLDPIEEARAFSYYVNQYGYGSVTELSRIIGKSEEYVSHRIKLLTLPIEVQEKVRRRLLTSSDAWELSRVKHSAKQKELADIALRHMLTVRQLRTAANQLNSGTPFSTVLENVCQNTRDNGLPVSETTDPEIKRGKLREAATSILRVAMVRIDNLVELLENDDPLHDKLMGTRLAVHQIIDEVSNPVQQFSPLSCNEFSLEQKEVELLIRRSFVGSLNQKNMEEVAGMRSKRKFTMYDDFPPFHLMNYSESIKHDSSLLGSIDDRMYEIDDLRVTILGNGSSAFATFTSKDLIKVKKFSYLFRSRVTLVLEKRDGKWHAVHEHWSQANPYEDTLDNMRSLEHQLA